MEDKRPAIAIYFEHPDWFRPNVDLAELQKGSGLLRFADLTMVTPNTIYPLFIVAPGERRNRVREQLARPSFRHLGIHEKVRYLSYERVNEIEDFFGESKSGLNVKVFVVKSEVLPD